MFVTVLLTQAVIVSYVQAALDGGHMQHTKPQFDRANALEISRAVLGREVGDVSFVDQNGEAVSLSAFRGKPLVVSLIYTSCYHICPTMTRHLDDVTKQARSVLGDDSFNIVSVGFDTDRDTPEMMQQFAIAQGISDPRWRFLSMDDASVMQLAKDLGFQYEASAAGYDHLIQTSLIDPDGKVFQQIYGMSFDAPLMIEPLKQFVFGVKFDDSFFATVSKKVRLFCTVYDPAMERYKFDYSLFIGMFIGFSCVGFVGYQLVREWRKTLKAGI